ncbi:MAG: hypothetical protein BGO38_12915 [Cellulomonas sp. 73-145]|uniref:DUF6297 family protein n=1 Tax=unclassified Cellulomonas TaxID=2620175 RepID=UPI0009280755|nr:DUF6297 family protein [Cellulomonas sp. 73-145]OJV59685.1 MAG: hypothetical protein BGO38_12915 [Cellulomonas sp. 73-145]
MTSSETVDGTPAVLPGERGELPSAQAVRRFTAAAGRTRAGAGVGSLLSDVYYAVIMLAIAVGVALGVAQQLRVALPPAPAVAAPHGLNLPTLVTVLVAGLVGVLVSLAGRLGPVAAGGAEASWWLSLPVPRRGLLRPAARRLPLVAAAAGAVVVALLDAGLLADGGDRVLRAAAAGALGSVLLVLLAAVGQSLGVARRHTALVGDLVLAAAPLVAIGLTLAGTRVGALPVPSWPLLVVAAVVVVGLAAVVDRRLDRIPARTLRESGSVVTQAIGAVVSMDSRELGRALSAGSESPARRRISRLRTVRGATSALITADLVLLRRSSRHVVQLAVAALVPLLATVVPQLAAPAAVLLALLLSGMVAQSATAEGARRGEMAPVLDRALPLAAKTVRRLRMVVPGGVMLVWNLVVFAGLGRWAADVPGWLALAVAGTPVWAAGAVRAAYRPAPDWNKPLVSTPMGALPTGVASVIARGPDVLVLGLLPTWIAVLLRTVSPTLLLVQAALAVVAVLISSSLATGGVMDWMARQQELLEEEKKKTGARTGRP